MLSPLLPAHSPIFMQSMQHNVWHTADKTWSLFIAATVPPTNEAVHTTGAAWPGPFLRPQRPAPASHALPVTHGPWRELLFLLLWALLWAVFFWLKCLFPAVITLSHPSSAAETFCLHNTSLDRPLLPSCRISSSSPNQPVWPHLMHFLC